MFPLVQLSGLEVLVGGSGREYVKNDYDVVGARVEGSIGTRVVGTILVDILD